MTKPRRRIIYVWNYLNWGGAQIYLLAIMKEAMADWDVVVAMPIGSSPDILNFIEQIGVECELIDACIDNDPAPTIRRKLERQWRRIRAEIMTFRYLRKFDLSRSILHIDFAPWQSWIFYVALSFRRSNVFVTLHNAPETKARWRRLVWKVRMQILSRVKGFHIFASNQYTKNAIRPFVSPVFWKNMAVTYTCVDPRQITRTLTSERNPKALRKELGFGEEEFVVLCVGQFIDRKGRWVFLDAAKILENDVKLKFIWLGPVPPIEEDSRRISEYQLGDNFRFIRSVEVGSTREDVLNFIRIGDVFALPSFVEGLPIALLEAMALGVPSISTNVNAIPEALRDRETGLLIEPGDPGGLADAIMAIKNDAFMRKNLGRAGSEFVLEHFDERVASQIAMSKYKECFDDV
ncbi:MAG: glycosyltransferase family 4 protein [Acidobacteriota bacterium]